MKLQYIPFAGQQLHQQWPHRAQAHCGQDTDCPFLKAFRALFSVLFAENTVPLIVQNGHNLKDSWSYLKFRKIMFLSLFMFS